MTRWKVSESLRSTELVGGVLFLVSAGLPPFDDATEVDLTLHMTQHVLMILAGVLIAYPHFGRRLIREGGRGLVPFLALMVSAALILFWHLPWPWDRAVLDPWIHILEHASFLAVGLLAGSWLLLLSDSGKIGALLAAFFGHMVYAVILISPWNAQVYSLYPLPNQMTLGWALLLTGPILLLGVAYVIARNPDWLGGYSGPGVRMGVRRQTFLNRTKVPEWVVPTLTIVMVVVMVGYFATTAYALQTAKPAPSGTVVYITGALVNEQYSPPSIRVVVGVNSTVTWVSRSVAYDTVTDRAGTFGSGTIAPGGLYTYTFNTPGVYDYYCVYHPWMTGTVVVTAGS